MGISIFKKSRGKEEIDIKEAFNICPGITVQILFGYYKM